MSTLTKVLIIVLTVASIFLSGIVVTYVANAIDYKERYDQTRSTQQAAKRSEEKAKEDLAETIRQADLLKTKLDEQLAALKLQVDDFKAQLDQSEREKGSLLDRVDALNATVKGFYTTTDTQGQLLKNAVDQLEKVRAEQIKQRKDLEETSTTLVEKLAVIALLEQKNKRLVEEKTELNDKLNALLRQFGKTAAAPVPVTAKVEKATVAPATKDIALKGLITALDLKNSYAQISIGSADGVKEGMKFHVTRGDQFICDVVVLEVDADKAVGWLELLQQQPKVGDGISTNL